MREASLIGNVFAVKKHLGWKVIITGILIALITSLIEFFLLNKTPTIKDPITSVASGAIALGVVYIIIKFRTIKTFFVEYVGFTKMSLRALVYALFEIILAFIVLTIAPKALYSWFVVIFWLFSGLQRVIIQKTKALFYSDMNKFMNFIQVYGYVRTGVFAITILLILKTLSLKLPLHWILSLVFAFLINLWYISNLWPYFNKHEEIEDMIGIIRCVAENKSIKKKHLPQVPGLEDKIQRLANVNYLRVFGNRVELQKDYLAIYME